jgi:hypothetical protein
MTGRALRAIGFVIAIAGMIDPAIAVRRARPLALEITSGSSALAARTRDELLRELNVDVSLKGAGRGQAVVAIDRDVVADSIRDGVPVSFVLLDDGPNVRPVRASHEGRMFPGERGIITVDTAVKNMAGKRSIIRAMQNGIEIGAVEHSWTGAEEQQVRLPFVALTPGSHRIQVVSEPHRDERRRDDNLIEVNVATSDRPLSVAFIEHRPSWSARFVREALELDTRVRIASLTRTSPGIERRGGRSPELLSGALMNFDLLAIGAPEELSPREVEAIRRFMSERGGAVLLLADRRVSGPILSLIPSVRFDEVLFTTPVRLSSTADRDGLRASEFAVPRGGNSSVRALATLPDASAAIASWPIGAGTLIVSGALDAWRYRASSGDEFASFWRALIAGAAKQTPRQLTVDLEPSIAAPGTAIRITARVRRTEFDSNAETVQLPFVTAAAVTHAGPPTSDFIRLWPASEPGVFRGEFVPSERRSYSVVVRAGTLQAAAELLPADALAEGADAREATDVAVATGGIVTTADRLAPLIDYLRAQPDDNVDATVHPMRNPWWIVPFAIALCIEWAMRRGRHLR